MAGKFLTLLLAGEGYAIRIRQVREIIRLPSITSVPGLPPHVKGVFNLRGRVVPLVDLRTLFGLRAEISPRTCVVVVHVRTPQATDKPVGVVVDGVEEVQHLGADEISPVPEFGSQVATQFLLGIARTKGQARMILDIDRAALGEE